MSERVPFAEIRELAPVGRTAWGAICAEALTRLYSRHFQELFDTEGAYSLAWAYIATGTPDSDTAKGYLRKCTRLGRSEEAYTYGLPNSMLAALVGEIIYPSGNSVIDCIGFCARMYSNILFFRHNIDDRVANFNGRLIESHISEYNRFSRTVYEFVRDSEEDLHRETASSRFALDVSAFQLAHDLYVGNDSGAGRAQAAVPPQEVLWTAAR